MTIGMFAFPSRRRRASAASNRSEGVQQVLWVWEDEEVPGEGHVTAAPQPEPEQEKQQEEKKQHTTKKSRKRQSHGEEDAPPPGVFATLAEKEKAVELAARRRARHRPPAVGRQPSSVSAKVLEEDARRLEEQHRERMERAAARKAARAERRRAAALAEGGACESTRHKANSWAGFVTGRPPFSSWYGAGNVRPAGYGDKTYMLSFNVSPDCAPNAPSRPQSHASARRAGRVPPSRPKKGNKLPAPPPLRRHHPLAPRVASFSLEQIGFDL